MSEGFSADIIEVLLRPIKPGRVATREGLSNMEGYDIRAHMNRMFSFGGWDEVAVDPTVLLYEQETTTKAGKPAYKVAYRASRRIVIRNRDGEEVCRYEGSAVGESTMPDFKRGDAHDMAIKTAETQALKRAAVNLGDQFGLSLYAKGSTRPVVGAVVGFKGSGMTAPELAEPDVVEESHDVAIEDTSYMDADEIPVSVPTQPPLAPEMGTELQPERVERAEPMITDAQVKVMQTLFGRLGVKERDEKLKYLSDHVGEAVGSSKDLTKVEAGSVITALQAEVHRVEG